MNPPNYPFAFAMPSSSSSDGELEELVLRQIERNNFMIAELLRQQNGSTVPLHLRPLVSAVKAGGVNALRLALENYEGKIDDSVEDGDTLLHLACVYGHLNCVKFLLEKGSNMEAKDEQGGIPLHDACEGGFSEIVQVIISHANEPKCVKRMLETVDKYGDTPLHNAARCELEGEYVGVIRLLLAHGASPTKKNFNGETPLELADSETEAWRVLKEAIAKD